MIALTHWTFEELDDAPADRLAGMRAYLNIKAEIEKRKMKMESRRKK